MKTNWQTKKLEECLEHVTYTKKIQRKDFLKSGDYPIVSQEKDLINGYWDNKKDLFQVRVPLVVFGDHTQILKYVDFDFVLGADGVKILQPKKFLDPKFFYYFLQGIDLKSLGYARHYRLLRENNILFPESLSEQKAIVKKLDELVGKTKRLETIYQQKIDDLEELKKSILQKAFNGKL